MLKRLFIKDYLSFDELNLEFDKGISVFSGVSGAGKSIIMDALLAVFGLSDCKAKVIEADIEYKFNLDEYGIISDEINNFRVFKEKTARYFINSSMISKKNLYQISNEHIKFLNTKSDELNSSSLLNLIDKFIIKDDKNFKELLSEYRQNFKEFIDIKNQLSKIIDDEKNILDLREFLSFEISKIEEINPKIGELEELLSIKKSISLKEKLNNAWEKGAKIFECERYIIDALNLSDIDTTEFCECMNNLREIYHKATQSFEDVDIEQILDRIEDLSYLNKKYGSIENAINTLKSKKQELENLNNIEFNKLELQKKYDNYLMNLNNLASNLSKIRKERSKNLEVIINNYLNSLCLNDMKFTFESSEIKEFGIDVIGIELNNTDYKKLSSGEYQRLRLAFIATNLDIVKSDFKVLIIDEIDANVSGKEAMSIAKILQKISKNYQIFAISHQPQLSSVAQNHFLVSKKNNISYVKKLNEDEKILELARMVSGDKISDKAIELAKQLRKT